jgi:PAS domain S-box-containing protein
VVLTLAQFYLSRRFLEPALTLARLAGAEVAGDLMPPQRVPAPWRPLVTRVAAAFAAARADGAEARTEAAAATRQVAQLRDDFQRLAAERRRDGENRRALEAAFAGSPAPLMILDRQGRILGFNRACERLSGRSSAQALGRTPWELGLPAAEAEAARRLVAAALEDEGPVHGRFGWPGRDAGMQPVWTLAAVSGEDGEPAALIGFALGQAGSPDGSE